MAVTLSFYYLLMYERIREVFHNIKPNEISCMGIAKQGEDIVMIHKHNKCSRDIDCNSILADIIEGLANIFEFSYRYTQSGNLTIVTLYNIKEIKELRPTTLDQFF